MNLSFPLESRLDKDGNVYYIAKVNPIPLEIDLFDGVTFLIFTSEEGAEELQIAKITGDVNRTEYLYHHGNKMEFALHSMEDSQDPPQLYFLAKIRTRKKINFRNGITFMIFTAKENEETVQIISGNNRRQGDNS